MTASNKVENRLQTITPHNLRQVIFLKLIKKNKTNSFQKALTFFLLNILLYVFPTMQTTHN